jgi:FMN-dependent NADH-azoreductase
MWNFGIPSALKAWIDLMLMRLATEIVQTRGSIWKFAG